MPHKSTLPHSRVRFLFSKSFFLLRISCTIRTTLVEPLKRESHFIQENSNGPQAKNPRRFRSTIPEIKKNACIFFAVFFNLHVFSFSFVPGDYVLRVLELFTVGFNGRESADSTDCRSIVARSILGMCTSRWSRRARSSLDPHCRWDTGPLHGGSSVKSSGSSGSSPTLSRCT